MPVDKSGRVYVIGAVPLLHPEVQTVDDMLDGWRNQQLCRNLAHDTIDARIATVRRFIAHTNEFPWSWTPAIVEVFFGDLRSVKGRRQSTVRGYQNTLRLFCSYIADPDYGWDRVCEQRFGTHPAQVFFAWNTAAHVQDNEQDPKKRPFTKQELQDFFDHADDQVTLIANSKKKGWLPAYLFPSEKGSLVAENTLLRRFRRYCNDLGLSDGLDLHSFRRSYITHLIEDGWDAKFVQDQAGHDYASTTSLYTGVSSDYRTRTLRRVLDRTIKDALSFGEESS
ncbi:site-specific recombinase XerD [Mycobacteroides abscessus subsp. massiliense]|uniref:tyrosine-type recombinase/integrase n=1 Tax=Mycobacteroides abscessus TaxID=36809 RepID=UPI0009C65C59|nr:tyrosine-type recombinase/integrase [Mycobacteroides abscessus]SKU05518.1 site-specific recombinase XerD [Mycobacteroides abscessus subsp. massiliense]